MRFFDISCWNVKRGEATIIGFPTSEAHVIDFGTNNPLARQVLRAIKEARFLPANYREADAVITHLHNDHYSLIPYILGSRTLRTTYLPLIPESKPVMKMVSFLLAYEAIILLRSGRAILDEIASKTQATYLVGRGAFIKLRGSFSARVLWPPPTLPEPIAKKVVEKLKPVYNKARRLVEKKGLNVKQEVEEKTGEIEQALGAHRIRRLEKGAMMEPIKIEAPLALPTLTKESLEEGVRSLKVMPPEDRVVLEKIRDAVNDLSLVLKYHYDGCRYALALVPGDNSRPVLDELSRLERGEPPYYKCVLFLRAAHHGTYYGKYIGDHQALVTWMSWTISLKARPHTSYLRISRLILTADPINCAHIHFYKPLSSYAHIHLCSKPHRYIALDINHIDWLR